MWAWSELEMSNTRGHHQHGHGHRRGPRREAALTKSQSNPSFLTNVSSPPSYPATVSLGKHQQLQQFTIATTVATGSLESQTGLWGEVVDSGRSMVAHKQPMRPLWYEGWKANSVTCCVPKLYQPQLPTSVASLGEPTASVATVLDHPRDRRGHNLVLHSIDMQYHLQELKHMISVAPSHQEIRPGSDPLMSAPPIPTRFWEPEDRQQQQPHDLLGPPSLKLPEVQLDQTALYLLLRKSVAAIAAHTGYESSSSRALDTLTDVLGDFLSRLGKLMRINTDQQAESGAVGFQDVLDQSLYQCGISGKAAVHKYWQSSVKGYAGRLQQAALEHQGEYKRLTEPPVEKAAGSAVKSAAPTSLSLATKTMREPVDFRLPSWLATTPDLVGGMGEEEIPLETVMQHANLDNVTLTRTPDLGGPVVFPQLSGQDTDGFASLVIGGPPRKRLRTISLSTPTADLPPM